MSPISHAFNEYSLVGTVHQAGAIDVPATLPANACRPRPCLPPQAAPREGIMQPRLAAIDGWFYRQQMKEREAYLAQAQDIFDLENRLRQLDRRPYF